VERDSTDSISLVALCTGHGGGAIPIRKLAKKFLGKGVLYSNAYILIFTSVNVLKPLMRRSTRFVLESIGLVRKIS
jgi:hypothetical protein